MYRDHIRPFIEETREPARMQWLRNILAGKVETGGCAANVWTALTSQALDGLSVYLILESKGPSPVPPSTRAGKAVSKVISILSPLVGPSRVEDFKRDLGMLVNSAMDVSKNAQAGELKKHCDSVAWARASGRVAATAG